eukprot:CAMPEP_0176466194 /NCGR_PEP_ID=MMETSP0127-20121128/37751_1 /TAXON_ID=938130 /ORGANISM="Platyophrya macrostoma, Strain WH" /LENGTH=173 /DNA_ID=CAMNT_0017859323 /DNA_START=66 /DNA_END=587 /DNA_ORIENTATION=-
MKLEPRERKQIVAFETHASYYILPKLKPKKKASKKKVNAVTKKGKKKDASSSLLLKAKSTSGSGTSLLSAAPTADEIPMSRQQSAKRDRLFREGIATHKWQYKNDQSRWADYDKKASDEVERAYASWLVDPHIDVRSVHSGDWDYMVDFNMMTQQNVRHHAHKVRQIQRVPIS